MLNHQFLKMSKIKEFVWKITNHPEGEKDSQTITSKIVKTLKVI